MRISTAAQYQQSLANMQMQTAAMAKTQTQLSSNLKWQTAGDDPAAYASAQNLDQIVALNTQYTSNAQTAQQRLQLSEGVVASGIDILQTARQLAIEANTATQSDASRATIAKQITSLRDQLLSLANTGDGKGRYLFGGSNDAQPPFTWNGSSADYHGDSLVTTAQVGTQRYVAQNDTGDAIFQNIATGNGTFNVAAASGNAGGAMVSATTVSDASQWDGGSYSLQFTSANQYQVFDASNNIVQSGSYSDPATITVRGASLSMSGTPAAGDQFSIAPATHQDAFAILDQLANLIAQPQNTATQRAQVQTALQQSLGSLQTAEDQISDVRSSIGTRMNAADDAISVAGALGDTATASAANLRDVDYAEAVTRLQQQMTALQAAQQTYVKVRGVSLFDYLR